MPEIKVNITKGSINVTSQVTEVPSNNLSDLLAALKTAKEQSNSALTKIVEESKETKQSRRISKDDDEDEEGSEEDDERPTKKPNVE